MNELELELAIAKKLNFDKREIAKLERLQANQNKPQPQKKTILQSIFIKLGVN